MPDYYQQPDYLKDLYNNPTQPQPVSKPQPISPVANPTPVQNVYPAEPAPQPVQPLPQPVAPVPAVQPPIEPVEQPAAKTPNKKRRNIIIIVIVVIVIILLLLVLLLGRGSSTPQKENIVLQWWGTFLEPEVVQPLIDEYQTENSHVTIEYGNRFRANEPYIDEVTRYKEELNRVLKTGNQVEIPDIFMVENTWVGDYEKYSKISNSYDITTFKDSFYDVVSTNFTQGNSIYGVPLWIDTYAVIYNKDLLAQASLTTPPTTWASFKTVAQQLTKRSTNLVTQGGFAGGTALNVTFAPETFQLLMLQNGVTLADEAGVPQFADDPDSLSALTFYKSFVDEETGTWDITMKNEASSFLEGDVAMIIAPSYRLREILRYNEQYDLGLDIGIAPIPQIEDTTNQFNWADYWGNMVANNRPNSTEAWKFLNWITQPDQLKKLSENVEAYNKYFGIVYPRKDMNSELVSDENLRVYNEGALLAESWYMIKGLDVEALFADLINETSTSETQIETIQEDIIELQSNQGDF